MSNRTASIVLAYSLFGQASESPWLLRLGVLIPVLCPSNVLVEKWGKE